jgi:hypothetical protein
VLGPGASYSFSRFVDGSSSAAGSIRSLKVRPAKLKIMCKRVEKVFIWGLLCTHSNLLFGIIVACVVWAVDSRPHIASSYRAAEMRSVVRNEREVIVKT